MPELADIFRLHGPAYLDKYNERLLASHRRVMQDVIACRTEALGGHLYRCPQCQQDHYRYHSCKNRHCPKCQNDQTDRWLNQQRSQLLPVPYFMATFTLPQALRSIVRRYQKTLYNILFQASQQALQKLASDPKYVGGTLGMVGVLQTWTRDLRYHPHVHYLIPGGGIAPNAKTWLPARENYLLPEKPLAMIFRAKFRDLLKKTAYFDQAGDTVWKQAWVVDIIPVGTGETALKYLAPYVFRVAISNKNIVAIHETQITFRYRDSKTKSPRTATVTAEEFIRRFLQHVLPKGFQKVRTYGLWHPRQRHRLCIVKEQLQDPVSTDAEALEQTDSTTVISDKSKGFYCPKCQCEMIQICQIPSKRGPP
jgi:hypothetical protein